TPRGHAARAARLLGGPRREVSAGRRGARRCAPTEGPGPATVTRPEVAFLFGGAAVQSPAPRLPGRPRAAGRAALFPGLAGPQRRLMRKNLYVEPASPKRQAGVFPLDHGPVQSRRQD